MSAGAKSGNGRLCWSRHCWTCCFGRAGLLFVRPESRDRYKVCDGKAKPLPDFSTISMMRSNRSSRMALNSLAVAREHVAEHLQAQGAVVETGEADVRAVAFDFRVFV